MTGACINGKLYYNCEKLLADNKVIKKHNGGLKGYTVSKLCTPAELEQINTDLNKTTCNTLFCNTPNATPCNDPSTYREHYNKDYNYVFSDQEGKHILDKDLVEKHKANACDLSKSINFTGENAICNADSVFSTNLLYSLRQ